ncbi:MAG: M42 family metallopeptidase [Planctomycetota bacterium]|jgi:putative aminopeptidase FrvX
MEANGLNFLKHLLNTPSPSGYEQQIQKVVREFVAPFADEVRTDWHGNVLAAVNPGGFPRIMLAGHCDQIGLMIKHVDDQGYLWCDPIGGWDVQMLVGQNMVVWGAAGPVRGVIARKAIHLLTNEERLKVPEVKDLWIDIGAAHREEALSVVAVGDPVTFELGFRELRNELAAAPGMDNKVGTWTVMSALQRIALLKPEAAVYAVSTVQEEIGLRGAITSSFSIDPHLGIAVDVTHATDCPTLDKKQHGDIKLGKGPVVYRGPNVNPVVHDQLKLLAIEKEIPIQIAGISKPAGNDANVMQISRGGQATGIVAIPNRYMHSPVEVISLDDLDNAAQLIAEFCMTLTADSDFTPR